MQAHRLLQAPSTPQGPIVAGDGSALPLAAAPGMEQPFPPPAASASLQGSSASPLTVFVVPPDDGSSPAAPAAQLAATDEALNDSVANNVTLTGMLVQRSAAVMQPQTLSAEAAVKAALADATTTSTNPSVPATPKPDLNGTFEAVQGSGALTCQIPELVSCSLQLSIPQRSLPVSRWSFKFFLVQQARYSCQTLTQCQ